VKRFIRVLIIVVAAVAIFTAVGLIAKPATPGLIAAFGYGLGASIRFWFITIPVIAGGLFVWMKLRHKTEAQQ
jgi:hypothetical protein